MDSRYEYWKRFILDNEDRLYGDEAYGLSQATIDKARVTVYSAPFLYNAGMWLQSTDHSIRIYVHHDFSERIVRRTFEGETEDGPLHQHDMVEIGGFTGRVTDIGIRYTKLLGMGDNIKIIANRDIRSVVNMTTLNSWYATTLTIPKDELSKAEAMLEKELPRIGESTFRCRIDTSRPSTGSWDITSSSAIISYQ